MLSTQATFKSPSQFVKGSKKSPPKSPQGKPGFKTPIAKSPKAGKKVSKGKQLLGKAMTKMNKLSMKGVC